MDRLNCTICYETLCLPITLACQHTYCKLCIYNMQVASKNRIGVSNNFVKCPTCRRESTVDYSTHNYAMYDFIKTMDKTVIEREEKINEIISKTKQNSKSPRKQREPENNIFLDLLFTVSKFVTFYTHNINLIVIATTILLILAGILVFMSIYAVLFWILKFCDFVRILILNYS